MYGTVWHITVGSVHVWDSVAHDSGFSSCMGQYGTWQWVQFMYGTVWHRTMGSVHDWDNTGHDNGFSSWLGGEIGEGTQNRGNMRSGCRKVKALLLHQPPWWKSSLDEDESHNGILSFNMNHAAVCTHKWSCPSMKWSFLCYIKYCFQPVICFNK